MKLLRSLLSSKKFTVALVAVIVWIAGLAGFEVDPQILGAVLSPLYAFILGQGVADAGAGRQQLAELTRAVALLTEQVSRMAPPPPPPQPIAVSGTIG